MRKREEKQTNKELHVGRTDEGQCSSEMLGDRRKEWGGVRWKKENVREAVRQDEGDSVEVLWWVG